MKNTLIYSIVMILMSLLVLSCSKEQSKAVSTSIEDEVELLPSSVNSIGYINFASLRQSPFYNTVKKNWEESPFDEQDYRGFLEETGFDLRKDLKEMYVNFYPETEMDRHPKPLIIVKGNLKKDEILAYIRKKAGEKSISKTAYKDFELFSPSDKRLVFCFPENDRVVIGPKTLVESWLNNFTSGDSGKNTELLEKIESLKYKSDGWLVVNARPLIDDLYNKFQNHPKAKNFDGLQSMKDVMLSVKFGDDLYCHGAGNFDDPEKARQFQDLIRGLLAAAKLSISDDREAIDILNKVKIEAVGKELTLDFHMSNEEFEKIIAKRKAIAMGEF